ncbi:unnamed protein product [Paramecium pentaurelia]|uniref:Uncharacterized protein n=1 Tax=Paramecium pentaurelia TaxID=43138 RepID=A0A8S1X466_9CILI|nr:unnamed protein product [Paramecium pentaurelia]
MNCTYQEKKTIADICAFVKDINEQIFGVILEIFRKEKVQDCTTQRIISKYLYNLFCGWKSKKIEQLIFQGVNLEQVENEQKWYDVSKEKISDVLKKQNIM